MGSGISISGGAGGTQANYDRMLATAARFDRCAGEVTDVGDVLASPMLRWQLEAADTARPGAGTPLLDTLATLQWLGPGRAADDVQGAATLLRFAAYRYQHADDGILHEIGGLAHGIGSVLGADADALGCLLTGQGILAAANHFLTDDPALVDLLADAGLDVAGRIDAAVAPDGRPVVHDLGYDLRDVTDTPPRDLTEVMSALGVRDQGADGEISVSVVDAADGSRRAIVDVTGTKSWSLTRTDDITSLVTNTRALEGERTSYEKGVLDAMTAAGVQPDDPVMIVGHSQGGMIAVNAARDAVNSGRFDVTHVVTAGSPLGRIAGRLPKSVQLLALEDAHDDVPHLDGESNPDEPTQTTVTGGPDHNSIVGDHSIPDSYVPLAEQVDASDDPSVLAWRDSAEGFFRGTKMTTHAFQITRTYH